MANEEQLARLKQGVDVWNKWRKVNQPISIDLTQADLSLAKLDGANLVRGAKLRISGEMPG